MKFTALHDHDETVLVLKPCDILEQVTVDRQKTRQPASPDQAGSIAHHLAADSGRGLQRLAR